MIMVIKNTVDMFCTSHFSHPIRFRAQGFRLDCRPPGRHCICTAPCCDTEFHAAPTQLKNGIRLQDRKQNELRTCFGMQCLNGCPTQICPDTMSTHRPPPPPPSGPPPCLSPSRFTGRTSTLRMSACGSQHSNGQRARGSPCSPRCCASCRSGRTAVSRSAMVMEGSCFSHIRLTPICHSPRLTPHVTDSPSDSHVSLSREPWALGPLPAPPRGLSQKRIDRSGGEGGRGKSGVTGGGLRAKGALLELALS